MNQPEVFLLSGNESESHSLESDSTTYSSINPTFDLTLDNSFSESGLHSFETKCNDYEIGIMDGQGAGSSTEDDCSCAISSEGVTMPNIAIPSFITDEDSSVCQSDDSLFIQPILSSSLVKPAYTPEPFDQDESSKEKELHRLMGKQRRLRRSMILKQKRALGLISINNCRKVRYQQKQVTALSKNRVNGKFSCNEVF